MFETPSVGISWDDKEIWGQKQYFFLDFVHFIFITGLFANFHLQEAILPANWVPQWATDFFEVTVCKYA